MMMMMMMNRIAKVITRKSIIPVFYTLIEIAAFQL